MLSLRSVHPVFLGITLCPCQLTSAFPLGFSDPCPSPVYNLFLPFPPSLALQACFPVSSIFPLPHACLVTDRGVYLMTCLVLFHPMCIRHILSVFASFWRFYAGTEVPHWCCGSIITSHQGLPVTTGALLAYIWEPSATNGASSRASGARTHVPPEERMPSGCPHLARRAVKSWCSVFNFNFPWIIQSEFYNLQYYTFCQHVGN